MRRLIGGTSGVLLIGLLVFALNLRAPITAIPPVVSDVSRDLGLTEASAGLLTSIPVFCFALFTPVASVVLARLGARSAVVLTLVVILAGTLVRSSGGFALALAGTTLIGAAIALGNVTVPVIVSTDFPSVASTVTGLYVGIFNVGSVATMVFTAPLAHAVGWRWAVASWGLLAIVALIVWRFAARHLRPTEKGPPPPAGTDAPATPPGAPEPPAAVGVFRRPLTWLLAIAFSGQAFGYYAITAWLPSILTDTRGIAPTSAGGAASLFQLLAIVGGVAVPMALAQRVPVRWVAMGIAACWLTLPIGLLAAPALWPLWCSLAGVAQGGNFAVIFTLVATRAGTAAGARRMSAAVQTAGYGCAALGPPVMGAVHTASGGWTVPLLIVLTGLVTMTAMMAIATGRPRAGGHPTA